MTETEVRAGDSGWKQRIGLALVEGGLAFAVLYVLGHRDARVIGPLVGAIVISALMPPRWSRLVSGVTLLGVAGYFRWQFGWTQIPLALGIIGAFLLVAGVIRSREK